MTGVQTCALPIFIMDSKVFADGPLQLDAAAMSTALDLFFAEQTEPTLDHVQPRGRGRREMCVKTRMPREPIFHRGRFVRAVVVQDQMHLKRLGRVSVDRAQELQELFSAVTPMQFADHLAGGHVQCCKQRGGPVPYVVLRTSLPHTGGQWQDRLRAVQCLDQIGRAHV